MVAASHLLRMRELGIQVNYQNRGQFKVVSDKEYFYSSCFTLTSHCSRLDAWNLQSVKSARGPLSPVYSRCNVFVCRSLLKPGGGSEAPVLKTAAILLKRSYVAFHESPLFLQLVPAAAVVAFAIWGLRPLMRFGRTIFLQKDDSNWQTSGTHNVTTSYLQPLLLWTGTMLICRALDPLKLPSIASQAVKLRLLNFARSLSTVLAFAYCLLSLMQQTQKFFGDTKSSSDARNMGFEFAGKAVYTAVWVAAISFFMELLGFPTQKWLTAGGLGTVLLTLAGREIFTNFLSSIIIHATRPFVPNDWIQTKIEGYEVSGTVEHVGWWSPTVIRGDDREAIHIPNHKFTVSVVRNLSQKTHWRIKTQLAISHLDVDKINNIVADMRKVLAKNPQVEQQKLHRRVFLDYVDPDSPALSIMVSCFVKTSHFEEYLCVKEAIMLDLLRVISHHRARLATRIRTVQKVYTEPVVEDAPFAETIFARSSASAIRPLLLMEPYNKGNADEKTKVSTPSAQSDDEKQLDGEQNSQSDSNAGTKAGSRSNIEESKIEHKVFSASGSDAKTKSNSAVSLASESDSLEQRLDKANVEESLPASAAGLKSDDTQLGSEAAKKPTSAEESDNQKTDATSRTLQAKQEGEKHSLSTSVSRPALEDNIILGVALEGSKRTLPIEEEMAPSSAYTESKELASLRNVNVATSTGKDNKDDHVGATPTAKPSEQKER